MTHLKSRIASLFIATVILASACSDNPSEPRTAPPTFSATVGGAAWLADTTVTAERTGPGTYRILGRSRTDPFFLIDFSLMGIKTSGTYPLGIKGFLSGGYVTIAGAPGGAFNSPTNGAAGQVEITTLSPTRIAGKFAFNAVGTVGTVGDPGRTVTVTNGVFDLPITGAAAGTIPDSAGGSFRATIDGAALGIAAATAPLPTSVPNRLEIFAFSDAEQFTNTNVFVTIENVTGPGTFPLDVPSLRRLLVQQSRLFMGSTQLPVGSWSSIQAGSSGSVTITSLTTARISGSITATIAAAGDSPITTPITFSASFDLGRR